MSDEGSRSSVPKARTWQHPQGGFSSGRASSSKRTKILTLLAVMASLAVIIIGLLLWIKPFSPPFFLSITVTEYGPHFPPIPFAEQDSTALLQHFPNHREAFESQEGARRLSDELSQLAAHKENAVVVHLCAYGVCRDNDVYIIPAKADPDVPNSELSLRELLSQFGTCRAPHKLLILDIMRPLAEPRLSILINPVAERAQAILKDLANKDLLPFFVLCSCSPGQVSLVSEELAMSVFGYYLAAGLSGQADGWEGKRDQRVSVHELFAFVTYHVDRWAVQNRGSRQTPVLFGRAKDFPLIARASPGSLPVPKAAGQFTATDQSQESSPAKQESRSSPPSPEAEPKTDAKTGPKTDAKAEPTTDAKPAYPSWLEIAWQVRDRWWKDRLYRIAPRSFRQLEGTLVRTEQRWRAGIEAGRIQSYLDGDVAKLEEQFEQAKKLNTVKIRLPALAAQNLQHDAATSKTLRDLLAQRETSPPVDTKIIQDAQKKFLETFKDKAPQQLAWTVFNVAADDLNPSPEKIRLLLDMLKSVPSILAPPADIEIDFLQKLGELKPDDEGKWPTEAAHHGLLLVRERGKAISADPRVLPWVRQPLEATARKRREGEKLLFAMGAEGVAQAASVLENTERDYKAINSSIQVIVKAQSTYDEALAALPGLVPYLVNRPELDPQDERAWQDAIGSAQKLWGLFDRRMREPVGSLDDLRTDTAELLTSTELLRRSLRDLDRPFRPDSLVELAARAESGNPPAYLEIQAVLDSPRLAAKERKQLYEARRRLAKRLLEKTKARDEKESPEVSRKTPPVNSADLLPISPEDSRARRRARLAIDLLKLGGVVGADELDKALDDKPNWQALGDKLLEAQTRRLRQQFEHLKPQELPQADRLSRVFHSFDRYPGENSNDFSNPAARLLQRQTGDFQKWLDGFQP